MGTTCSSINSLEGRRCEFSRCTSLNSILIHYLGCDKLATIEENLIMAFIPQGTADETRLVIVLNRANQVSCSCNPTDFPT